MTSATAAAALCKLLCNLSAPSPPFSFLPRLQRQLLSVALCLGGAVTIALAGISDAGGDAASEDRFTPGGEVGGAGREELGSYVCWGGGWISKTRLSV